MRLTHFIILLFALVAFLAVGINARVQSKRDIWIRLGYVEFQCSTDSECFRDCMDLIEDAEECERGLMEGGS